MKVAILLLMLFSIPRVYSQDTIWLSVPHTGDFWFNEFDSIAQKWSRKDFINNTLFSVEQLADNTFHPAGAYVGHFTDGTISFKRNFIFNVKYSEIHGVKCIYFKNGNLKEIGQFHHGIKFGNWVYYNSDGSINKRTQYIVPEIDTVTSALFRSSHGDHISIDTITSDEDPSFLALFPCVNFGKNGLEIRYNNNKPIEVRKFEYGKLIFVERRKHKVKNLIKNEVFQHE